MPEKVVLMSPYYETASSYSLGAAYAVEVDPYNEAAIIARFERLSHAKTLHVDTAAEPIEGAFVEVPGGGLSIPAGAGTHFMYVKGLSRYLKWRLEGESNSYLEFQIDMWLK